MPTKYLHTVDKSGNEKGCLSIYKRYNRMSWSPWSCGHPQAPEELAIDSNTDPYSRPGWRLVAIVRLVGIISPKGSVLIAFLSTLAVFHFHIHSQCFLTNHDKGVQTNPWFKRGSSPKATPSGSQTFPTNFPSASFAANLPNGLTHLRPWKIDEHSWWICIYVILGQYRRA